jgi:hypothetical protein
MKIFIKDFNLDILLTKLKSLEKYLYNTYSYYDIYSKEGHFNVDGSNIYNLIHNDNENKSINNFVSNYSIIIDYSETKKEKINYLPHDHIILPIKNLYYKLNENSKIQLLIQINWDVKTEVNETIILDFYFVIEEEKDINNIFIKNELNVFLSLLN